MALAEKLVDGLKTRDELRAMMIERGAKDADENTFRQVGIDDYAARIKPQLGGDAVGVVVAEGEIVDGKAPAGNVGGLSTANLIQRRATTRTSRRSCCASIRPAAACSAPSSCGASSR